MSQWIDLLSPAVARCAHEHRRSANRRSSAKRCKLSLERLMTFPFIAERVKAGTLSLEGARFGIGDGKLELLDKTSGEFRPVV